MFAKWFSSELREEGSTILHEFSRLLGIVGINADVSRYYKKFTVEDLKVIETAVSNNLLPVIFEDHGISEGLSNGLPLGIHYITIHSLKIEGDNVSYTFWHRGGLQEGPYTYEVGTL